MAQQTIDVRPTIGSEKRFYVVTALVAALIIFIGFAPSYYLKGLINAPPPLSPLTHAHGFVFSLWVVLFVTQAALIGVGQPKLHRQLGILGAMLYGAVVTLGLSTAITAGQLGHAPPGSPDPLVFMSLPVLGIIGAAGLVVLALINRTRRDHHQRLMLASFVMMTQPAIGRLFIPAGMPSAATQGSFLAIEALLLLVIGADYLRLRRIHPAWMVSLAVLAVTHLAVTWAFTGPALWMDAARWMTRAAA